MNRFRLGMIGFSAIVSSALAYSGIPEPTRYLCHPNMPCGFVPQLNFIVNGVFDFILFFDILILISEFVIAARLERVLTQKERP